MDSETRSTFGMAASILVAVAAGGIGSSLAPEARPDGSPDLLKQLQHIGTLALFVERSVEVWLGITEKNGPERVPLTQNEKSGPSAIVAANKASLLLGLLLAFTGVRILPSLGITYITHNNAMTWVGHIQAGIDILITGAMIAGGSVLVHEVTEAIKGAVRKSASPGAETPKPAESAVTSAIASRRAVELSMLASALKVEEVCESEFDANKGDCNLFAKAVASKFNVQFAGQADDIVDQIRGSGWTKLGDGVQAKAMAEAGMFVVAGLKGGDHKPARPNGHVAIVVAGPLAHNKYPMGYWGSLGGTPGKKQTLNYSWNSSDRDNVEYAARTI